MKQSLKVKWAKALQSGKYSQGVGLLKIQHGCGHVRYCCLGVLRDIVHPSSTIQNGDLLCEKHLKEFGLTEIMQERLARMNDNRLSFRSIAAYILKSKKI